VKAKTLELYDLTQHMRLRKRARPEWAVPVASADPIAGMLAAVAAEDGGKWSVQPWPPTRGSCCWRGSPPTMSRLNIASADHGSV
jgi:hypothetical protein